MPTINFHPKGDHESCSDGIEEVCGSRECSWLNWKDGETSEGIKQFDWLI